jgi:ribosome-associated toxin RatA of RatAB toxin-antitoxin module
MTEIVSIMILSQVDHNGPTSELIDVWSFHEEGSECCRFSLNVFLGIKDHVIMDSAQK